MMTSMNFLTLSDNCVTISFLPEIWFWGPTHPTFLYNVTLFSLFFYWRHPLVTICYNFGLVQDMEVSSWSEARARCWSPRLLMLWLVFCTSVMPVMLWLCHVHYLPLFRRKVFRAKDIFTFSYSVLWRLLPKIRHQILEDYGIMSPGINVCTRKWHPQYADIAQIRQKGPDPQIPFTWPTVILMQQQTTTFL